MHPSEGVAIVGMRSPGVRACVAPSEGDSALFNIYHVMPVNPAKFSKVNAAAGQVFAN